MSDVLQNRAITELVANGGTVAAAMRKAGYSPNTARTPKKLTSSIAYKEKIKPVLERMEALREKAISALESRTLDDERAKDVADMIKGYTHDIQLLGGKATENIAVKTNAITIKRYGSEPGS